MPWIPGGILGRDQSWTAISQSMTPLMEIVYPMGTRAPFCEAWVPVCPCEEDVQAQCMNGEME